MTAQAAAYPLDLLPCHGYHKLVNAVVWHAGVRVGALATFPGTPEDIFAMQWQRHTRAAGETPFAEVLERACGGDREAQALLLATSEPHMRALAARMLARARFASDGEDVLQSVRLELIKALPGLRTRAAGAFHVWLARLVRSRVLDWQKARRRGRRIPTKAQVSLQKTDAPEPRAAAASPSQIAMRREQREQLARAIERVPERYRPVLRLIQAQEPTPEALAAFLGKEPEAARKFVGRALAHLRETLKGVRARRTAGGALLDGAGVRIPN